MNRCAVTVLFGHGSVYGFEFTPDELETLEVEDARAWLMEQFDALGCEPSNPMGKVLLADMVFGVAERAGEQPFAGQTPFAREYARACARLHRGARIEIDLAAFEVRSAEGG